MPYKKRRTSVPLYLQIAGGILIAWGTILVIETAFSAAIITTALGMFNQSIKQLTGNNTATVSYKPSNGYTTPQTYMPTNKARIERFGYVRSKDKECWIDPNTNKDTCIKF